MYDRSCLRQPTRTASGVQLALKLVFKKISKQNSRMLPYCGFNGFWS